MQVVYYRLFVRIVILVITVFSIFYFYVFGYKYSNKIGFYKANSVYDIKLYSKLNNNSILLDGTKYNLVDNKLVIFGLSKNSCGYIKLSKKVNFVCNNGYFNKIVNFSDLSLKKVYTKTIIYPLDLFLDDSFGVSYKFSWDKVNFFYYKNGDLVYKDSIGSHFLINLSGASFVGYDNNGLYLILKGDLYFLKLKFN